MAQHILAGDIGGTKTNLALYVVERSTHVTLLRESSFANKQYEGLETVIREFLQSGHEHVSAAAFGIAGPVLDGVVLATNLPWKVETDRIASVLGCSRIRLMNDLETTAYGSLFLPPHEVQVLHEGKTRYGHRVVIVWNAHQHDSARAAPSAEASAGLHEILDALVPQQSRGQHDDR